MRAIVAEGLGSAVLVVTACLAAVSPSELAPLTVPAVWGALLVAGRGTSATGLFLHPALAAAAWVAGRLRSHELGGVLAAQAVGAAVGAVLGSRAGGLISAASDPLGVAGEPAAASTTVAGQALPIEALVVAVLTLVALSSHPAADPVAHPSPGLPVALVAAAATVLVGPVTGGAFNPAVAVALAHATVLPWDLAVAYVPAHLAGALVAALVVTGRPPPRPTLSAVPGGVPRQRQVADAVPHGS